VAKVSTAASTILEADKLFDEIVNLIRDQFDFYYVGLFLIDQAQQWAELWAGTGEAGRIQLERKHRLEIGGESMIGWSVAHRRARIALDVGAEAVRFQNPILPDTRSEMALPLVSRDEVIGALTVQSVKPGAFSDEDVTALQTMADQVANAIANVRLFELTQTALSETQASQERLIEYSEQLQQLQKITQKLARELEPGPEVYYEAIGAMADLLKARYAALALLDEAGNYNQFIHYGISDEQAKLMGDLPTGRGLLGALSREGQPIRIKNIQTDDRSVGFPAHHPDMKSLLGVPIIFQDKILGRLYFTEHHSGEFGADEQALVTSFASSLAGTLQAVKLFAQTQAARQESERQAYEANLLDKVNQVLITEPNLGAALHAVTESMVENFEAAFARLWVLDDTGQTLLLRASSGLYTHLDGGHAQVPVGKFKIGLIAEERQPHLTNDILNDPRLGDPVWAKQEGMVAFAGYPLLVGERLIGVLAMFARQPLPTETLTILGRLAERAAVAIDNRRLLEQTQRRAHRERILYEVSTNMRQSLNPETIIKTGLAVLGQELGQSGITIHLMPKGNGK
jgi:GAF domain-containing protein